MSFLDSLENSVKAMESRVERDPAEILRDQANRASAVAAARATAPWAEKLRASPFTDALMVACRTVGHRRRTMVRMSWLDSTLRFEAKEQTMELQPGPGGIRAVFFHDGKESGTEAVDLESDATALAERWLDVP